jgi:hypothetical protein
MERRAVDRICTSSNETLLHCAPVAKCIGSIPFELPSNFLSLPFHPFMSSDHPAVRDGPIYHIYAKHQKMQAIQSTKPWL